jgi:hypothetical protein
MQLTLDELECLKGGETLRLRLDEVLEFLEEKGIGIEKPSHVFYEKDKKTLTLSLGLYLSIPLNKIASSSALA